MKASLNQHPSPNPNPKGLVYEDSHGGPMPLSIDFQD
jgi:hypothetical protein